MKKENEKVPQEAKLEQDKNWLGTISVIGLSVLCALIAALLLFVKEIDAVVMCYILCGGLIVWGISQIVKFFVTKSYHNLHDYSFSVGALLVILGSCGVARATTVAQQADGYAGLLSLILGIIMIQNTVQLFSVQKRAWIVELILAAILLFGAISVLADFSLVLEHTSQLAYWLLLTAGIANAVSFGMVAVAVKSYEKEKAKKAWTNQLAVTPVEYPSQENTKLEDSEEHTN